MSTFVWNRFWPNNKSRMYLLENTGEISDPVHCNFFLNAFPQVYIADVLDAIVLESSRRVLDVHFRVKLIKNSESLLEPWS